MFQKDNNKRSASSEEAQKLREFHSDQAPLGENIKVTLKGKSWGRSLNLICYFTDNETDINFQISVFRSREDGKTYGASDFIIDFSEPGIVGNEYLVTINRSKKARFPSLKSAVLAN